MLNTHKNFKLIFFVVILAAAADLIISVVTDSYSKTFNTDFKINPILVRNIDPMVLEQRRLVVERALIKPIKVFQIGFSKCGTVTLSRFFYQSGVNSVHHDAGKLAISIYQNSLEGKPLISPAYDDYWVFTDMERMYADPPINIGMILFKELDRQYPGSKFILNTRNKQAWLKSRSVYPVSMTDATTLLTANARILKISEADVLEKWSREWDQHHIAVKEYFKNRPNDLIVFNIETDSPQKLMAFFKENFLLDPQYYLHRNKTVPKS